MLGDILKSRLSELKESSENSRAKNAFWVVLRDIAINLYPEKVDSD